MKNKIFLLLLLSSLISFSQNQQLLKDHAIELYNNGDLIKSFEVLNKINDKKILEKSCVNLYKKNIKNILNHEFCNKIKLNDSIYKVYIKTSALKSQGILNTKTNQYIIQPIFDSIVATPNNFQKYVQVYKDNSASLISCETGKTIIPFGNHKISFDTKYIYTNTKGIYDAFSENGLTNVYDIEGNLLLSNLNTFGFIYPKFYGTKNKNNKYQIVDFNTKEIIIDDIDYYNIPPTSIVENKILFENNWISFSKNNKLYLYKITKDKIENTKKFDTYIYINSNYNYFDNTLKAIINHKESAINKALNEQNKCCWSDYTIVKKGAKYGIFNVTKDQYYKEPIYDSINNIGNTFYNGKWINLIYDEEICAPKTKDYKAFIFKRNNLFGLLNFKGKIIANAKYDEIQQGYNDVYYLRKGAKWGFIGTNETDILVDAKFDFISGSNGKLIGFKNKSQTQFSTNGIKLKPKTIDKNQINKVYIYSNNENYYDSKKIETNRQVYKKNDKFGLDDLNHNEIIPPTYSSIGAISKDKFLVSLDTLVGLIDENGKIIIPIKHSSIKILYDSNLLEITNNKGLHAIYDFDGKMLYPFEIEQIINSKVSKNKIIYYFANKVLDTINYKYEAYKAYPKIVLKVENGKVEKLNLKGTQIDFLFSNYLVFGDTELKGFYNLVNGKYIEPQYSSYIDDYQNNRIFAKKGMYYDTLMDELENETTLAHPFFEAVNDYYYFKEKDKIGVMDKNLKVANFNYPILENLVKYDTYSDSYSNEYREIASTLFKFNTDVNSKKYGVINFDGTVIFQPNIYDEISFINFDNKYYNAFKYSNSNYKKFCNNLFITYVNKKESKQINLINSKKETIATFEIKNNESWNFCAYNNGILIKSRDSIKQYNIKTKKIDVRIKASQVDENCDFGYTLISNLDNNKINIKKYTNSGLFILDTIIDSNKRYSCRLDYENYILKKNNKYGTINSKGNTGIPYIYDLLESKNGQLFIAKKDNLYGVVDAENQIILDRKYQEIKWKDFKNPYSDYTNRILINLFAVKENNKWGLINLNTKTILPTKFDSVEVQYNNIIAKKDSLVSVFDYNGILKFSVAVDSIKSNLYNNYNYYKNGKEVFRNQNGTIVDKNPYISWEEETKLKYSKQINSKFYLSKNGSIIYEKPILGIEEVDATEDSFLDDIDYLLIQDENNLKGLYTTKLEEILPFVYNEIIVLKNQDYIIAKKNDKYGVVDKKNNISIPFEYDEIQYYNGLFKCKINNIIINKTPQNKTIYNIKKRVPPIIIPD